MGEGGEGKVSEDDAVRKETNGNHSPKAALTPSATKTLRACNIYGVWASFEIQRRLVQQLRGQGARPYSTDSPTSGWTTLTPTLLWSRCSSPSVISFRDVQHFIFQRSHQQ